MEFQVPQFIEVEDKLFGPLTIKQFVYLVGGAGMCYVIYSLLPIYIAIFLMLPVGGLAVALAFYKINDKPFINVLEAAVYYLVKNKLYIWRKIPRKIESENKKNEVEAITAPRLSESRLKELAWSLDINEKTEEKISRKNK